MRIAEVAHTSTYTPVTVHDTPFSKCLNCCPNKLDGQVFESWSGTPGWVAELMFTGRVADMKKTCHVTLSILRCWS